MVDGLTALRALDPQESAEGWDEVCVLDQLALGTGDPDGLRPLDDPRDAQELVVADELVAEHAVTTDAVAVVSSDDHHGLVPARGLREVIEQAPEQLVHVGDAAVVETVEDGEVLLAHVHEPHGVRVGSLVDRREVLASQLGGDEALSIAMGRAVFAVRLHQVRVDEARPLVALLEDLADAVEAARRAVVMKTCHPEGEL